MSILNTRNVRIGVGVAAVAAGFAAAKYSGGVSSGILGSIARADTNAGSKIIFPQELEQNDHWIKFTAKKTTGAAEGAIGELFGSSGGFGTTVLGGSIMLPMPANLSTDYNPQYSTPDLGPAAGMALKPSDQAIYGNNTMGGKVLEGAGLTGLASTAFSAVTGGLAGAAINKISQAGSILGAQSAGDALLKVAGGVALNPHKIVLFTGVNFREHQFSWKLSPKNRRESDAIRQIIEMFTYYSHPEYIAGGLFFKYPEYFTIEFRHPEYLFKLQPSVCKDIRVNYHGQGYPAYIRDWNGGGVPAPAEVELSLTFMETEVVTKNSLTNTTALGIPLPTPVSANPLTQDPQVMETREQILQRTNPDRISFQRDLMLGGVGGF